MNFTFPLKQVTEVIVFGERISAFEVEKIVVFGKNI